LSCVIQPRSALGDTMYLMFGDEPDRDAVQGKKFFVYGGVFAPTGNLALHDAIESLLSSLPGVSSGGPRFRP
jgi:hypothetical protein